MKSRSFLCQCILCCMFGLYLNFVHQESKSFIEQRLLEIKGVISFTFDISRHRCFVRSRNEVNPEVCLSPMGSLIHRPFLIIWQW